MPEEFERYAPLNRPLFDRLQELYGRGGVVVAKHRTPMLLRPTIRFPRVMQLQPWPGQNRQTYEAYETGEYYRIGCPFCVQKNRFDPDTKKRLWINHRWGWLDPSTGDSHRWAIICFHKNCLSDYDNNRALYRMVYEDRLLANRLRNAKVETGEIPEQTLATTTYPGECVPLDTLPADHQALTYLQGRGYDPYRLSEVHGVRYCVQSPPPYGKAAGRLIVPLFMNGNMVTWQGRWPADLHWKQAGIPKYYNQRNAAKTSCLYGFDQALGAPFVVVTEGITDVWRLGSGAVAILGKSISFQQFQLLRNNWPRIVIALDADAFADSQEQIERLRQSVPTIRVQLPEGHDPDTMPPDLFWQLVQQTAWQAGLELNPPVGV